MQVAGSEMCSSLMVSALECRSSSHGLRPGYCVAFFCKGLNAGKGVGGGEGLAEMGLHLIQEE